MSDVLELDLDAMYDAGNRWYYSVDGQLTTKGKVECSVCYRDSIILPECIICRKPFHFSCGVDDECNDCIEERGRIAQKITRTIHEMSNAASTTWYADYNLQGTDEQDNDGWIIWSHDYKTGDPVFINMPSTYEQARRIVDAHNNLQVTMAV